MANPSLAELCDLAASREEPAFTSILKATSGGVDPLGLRQINFDLMDLVFPGLNNVASHIRPFTVVTWAWRRAATCARDMGRVRIDASELQDFVDRVEVIYAWSQFRRNPPSDLPGRDVLAPLIAAGGYTFGGDDWQKRREIRDDSTALSAPINYGPGLKGLGWLQPDEEREGAWVATELAEPAIVRFEAEIAPFLHHPAFCKFGPVSITNAEVDQLKEAWALERPTEAEKLAMTRSLTGDAAGQRRRDGIKLAIAAVHHLKSSADVLAVRRTMCGPPTDFVPPAELQLAARTWRAVQVRQAFRLALEASLHWILRQLDAGPMTTGALANAFLDRSGDATTTADWLSLADGTGPADWIDRLEQSLANTDEVALLRAIHAALGMSLAEAPDKAGSERDDRLPLARAAREARTCGKLPPADFVAHIIESWIFGQHVYWSVGRGLADARGRGKTILRLKATLEDGGWTLAPGVKVANRNTPRATPDRLETVLRLAKEADLVP